MGSGGQSCMAVKRCFSMERTTTMPSGVRVTDDLQRLINRWKSEIVDPSFPH